MKWILTVVFWSVLISLTSSVRSILSQIGPPDPLSGSGWLGAGILGLVLGWLLLRHLPAKDKQLQDLIDTFSNQNREQRESHEASVKLLALENMTNLKSEREQCHQDNLRITEMFASELRMQREVEERRHRETLEVLEKRHSENLQRHAEVLSGLKEARHNLKDVSQAVGLHHALIDQTMKGHDSKTSRKDRENADNS